MPLLTENNSPDIEDVQAVAKPILRHRILRNFKAESEGITIDQLIDQLTLIVIIKSFSRFSAMMTCINLLLLHTRWSKF